MKYKILTILGTRPEIIRLSCIINKLNRCFNHILVNTNQNFDPNLNEIFFKELGISKPKYIYKNLKKTNPIDFLANALNFVDKILEKEKPDAVLYLGDTNTALTCICAKKRKIPIFHIEAGNRCFDDNVPEEVNRRVVDHIADINMTYSKYAEQNLLLEGIKRNQIIKIGSPLYEVYKNNSKNINNSKVLDKYDLKLKSYILCSLHRQETVENKKKFKIILKAIEKFAISKNLKVIFSTHPRVQKKISWTKMKKNIFKFMKPFGFKDYAKLMMNAEIFISDSGSVTEETAITGVRSVNLRETFERQEGLEQSLCILSGITEKSIISSLNLAFNSSLLKKDLLEDYYQPHVSEKVVKIIQSYIPYVNKYIWKK
jgi:UDP-N-acetyl-L-fucosamine synthase